MVNDNVPAQTRRVGILTFHSCINYGSYWQARCLVEGLGGLGVDAVLLDHVSPEVNRAEWRCALRPAPSAPASCADFSAYAVKARKFFLALRHLPRSRPFPLEQPEQAEAFPTVVVGSDEVWNLCHPWYGGKAAFYGVGLKRARLISYAASFGNQDASGGLHPWWAGHLREFDAISVRDDNSRRIVAAATQRDAELVLDPCLQFPPTVARSDAVREEVPYVAVYGHGFPEWLASRVRRWTASRRMRIVSIGYRNEWADEQRLSAGPEEFPAFIAGAGAVVTNFFHGCVFALLFRRPLLTAPSDYRFLKVDGLMRMLGGERHVASVHTPRAEVERLLCEPVSDTVQDRVDALRHASADYLRAALVPAS